ncbi:PAP2 superfamily protein [Prauserella shujinwangii]|uniref:PAP2 superfamily protein n=1 Tax=Prauserella shujinwangii TaxID=1453103 RepID=A0A2T0M433_9PSEU|nr:phosphatase PAP2 family protein [Prauserella shujinwangii]PRX51490.1 PAP2 superfamily protein [Prauserella shujinwangii]
MAVDEQEGSRAGGPEGARPRWWAEILLLGLGFGAFQLLWVAVSGDASVAIAHSDVLYRLEQALGLAVEPWFYGLAGELPHLEALAGYYYVGSHFAVTGGVLVWLWWRRPGSYRPLRSTLIGSSLVALVCFWAVPVAPPRLALAGAPDTLVQRDIFGSANPDGGLLSLANPFAAMPSLHVAWAVWVALALHTTRHPLRRAGWLYPLTTTVVVLVTGNHYVLDAVGGTVLVLAVHSALGRARAVSRRVPGTGDPAPEADPARPPGTPGSAPPPGRPREV